MEEEEANEQIGQRQWMSGGTATVSKGIDPTFSEGISDESLNPLAAMGIADREASQVVPPI